MKNTPSSTSRRQWLASWSAAACSTSQRRQRSSAALTAVVAICASGTSLREPPKVPIAVRVAEIT